MVSNGAKDGKTTPAFSYGPELMLEKYEIEVKGVSKGRGMLSVDSDRGRLLLREFKGSKEKGRAMALLLKYIGQWDMTTEQILPNCEGEYVTVDEDGKGYILKTEVGGRECETRNQKEIVGAVKKIAELHTLLENCPKENEEMFRVKEHELNSEVIRHNRELNYVKNYIQKKKQKNAFEELFLGCFQEYFQQAKAVSRGLVEFEEKYEGNQVTGFCHGDCNQHNIVTNGKVFHIIHYEQLRYDMPVADLAKFMRKILEKNMWDVSLGMEMIDAYEQVRILSFTEKWQLYYRLAYPEKFWKIANHYNNSRKAWVSGRDIDKLVRMQNQEEVRKQFLEILFYLGR